VYEVPYVTDGSRPPVPAEFAARLAELAGDGAGAHPPLRLVAAGSKSPAWTRNSMRSLAGVLPRAEHRVLDGQTHIVKPAALAPVLSEFFQRKG
jgi:hypothetical protein